MKAFTDLHIHSALSPCSSDDMTPNNIVNMAWLKGLDIIAVTDHNSVENCSAVMECSTSRGILVVPGMELETREEVHVICLFPSLEAALTMQELVYHSLPPLKNREDIFGRQLIVNSDDQLIGPLDRLLLTSTSISIENAFLQVLSLGGVLIPAHVDREANSILTNLGSIPEDLKLRTLELSRDCNRDEFLIKNPTLNGYNFVKSSDAHDLGRILEKANALELEEMSIACLIHTLKNG